MTIPKTTKFQSRSARSGVTIIEVLTSIVVAVIGVAGVLVMIPFGIRQAQTGLDLHDTTTLAENALQEFQIRSYGQLGFYQGVRALPWIDLERDLLDGTPPNGPDLLRLVTLDSNAEDPIGWFLVDPLWASAFANTPSQYPTAATMESMFNYVGSIPADADVFMNGIPQTMDPLLYEVPPFFPRYVQLLDLSAPFSNTASVPPVANAMALGMADRIFRSRDDIQFAVETNPGTGTEIDPRDPPVPYLDYYYDPDNLEMPTAIRRQFAGDISWSAVAVPKRNSADVNLLEPGGAGHRIEGFDFYVMVYQDRSFENPGSFAADRDPRFIYTALDTVNNPAKISGTGSIALDAAGIDIRNDEWVMLINYDLNGESQIGFYRVIGSYENSTTGESSITIDGSDFQITDTLDDGSPNRTKTFVVYLPYVVNVFKRQLNFENSSNY